jgi:hypothetical protein
LVQGCVAQAFTSVVVATVCKCFLHTTVHSTRKSLSTCTDRFNTRNHVDRLKLAYPRSPNFHWHRNIRVSRMSTSDHPHNQVQGPVDHCKQRCHCCCFMGLPRMHPHLQSWYTCESPCQNLQRRHQNVNRVKHGMGMHTSAASVIISVGEAGVAQARTAISIIRSRSW